MGGGSQLASGAGPHQGHIGAKGHAKLQETARAAERCSGLAGQGESPDRQESCGITGSHGIGLTARGPPPRPVRRPQQVTPPPPAPLHHHQGDTPSIAGTPCHRTNRRHRAMPFTRPGQRGGGGDPLAPSGAGSVGAGVRSVCGFPARARQPLKSHRQIVRMNDLLRLQIRQRKWLRGSPLARSSEPTARRTSRTCWSSPRRRRRSSRSPPSPRMNRRVPRDGQPQLSRNQPLGHRESRV